MKITYIYPSLHYPGGISRILTIKMNYLADVLGYDVTILTYSQFDKGFFFQLSENVKQLHFDIRRNTIFNGNFLSKKIQEREFLKQYKSDLELFLKQNPQDILITTTFGLEYKFLYKLKDKSKKIGEFHFAYNKSLLSTLKTLKDVKHPKDILDVMARRSYIKSIRGLDHFVLLTKRDLQSWNKLFSNTSYISNPISLSTDKTSSCSSKTVLAIGRFHYQKGFDYLIDVWRQIAQKHLDWKLRIVGNGEEEAKIRDLINKYNLQDSITIISPSQQVNLEYLNSSIYVMTSRFEGLPLVLIEAMHFGLPIVSFDCECGPSDLIEDGINGYLSKVGDTYALADHIHHLIENPSLRKQMGEANREKSFNYKLEPIMKQWDNLFKTLLK